MKIAFVVANLDTGGAERHVVTLAPALAQRGHEVSVHCVERPGGWFDALGARGVSVACLDSAGGSAAALGGGLRLARTLRQAKPDVVVTSGFKAGILGRIAARLAGVEATVTWKHNIGHLGLVGFKERTSERLLSRLTTRYLAVCHAQIPYLVNDLGLDPERIGVVHNSISPDEMVLSTSAISRSDIGLSPTDLVVGVVAMVRAEKDHPTMLRAFAQLNRHLAGRAKLVIVGGGAGLEGLRELAEQLRISSEVVFLGERSDVVALLPLFDVVALASYTIECFPYSILEAMAASRPVVATAVGGLPELVGHDATGLLVPPRAPLALAEALGQILGDPQRAQEMGEAGRERLAKLWQFDQIVDKAGRELGLAVGAGRSRTAPGRSRMADPLGVPPPAGSGSRVGERR